jgi:hypothetical protein
MSDSNIKLPTTTELEGRVREALKVARREHPRVRSLREGGLWIEASTVGKEALEDILLILEDGGA